MLPKNNWTRLAGRAGLVVTTSLAILVLPGCFPDIGLFFSLGKPDCGFFTGRVDAPGVKKFFHGAEFRARADQTTLIYDHETVYHPGFDLGLTVDYAKLVGEINDDRSVRVGVGNPDTGAFHQVILQPYLDGWQASYSDQTGVDAGSINVYPQGAERETIDLRILSTFTGVVQHRLDFQVRPDRTMGFQTIQSVEGVSADLSYVFSYGADSMSKREKVRFSGFNGTNGTPTMTPAFENQLAHRATSAFDRLENAKTIVDDCAPGFHGFSLSQLQGAEGDLGFARDNILQRYGPFKKKADPVKKVLKEIDKTLKLISKAGQFVAKEKPPKQKPIWKKIVRAQKRCVRVIRALKNLPPIVK